MNEKAKRTRLNDAFKRFQRLPVLLPKSDMRETSAEKSGWVPLRFGLMSQAGSVPGNSSLQALAE